MPETGHISTLTIFSNMMIIAAQFNQRSIYKALLLSLNDKSFRLSAIKTENQWKCLHIAQKV